MVVWHEQADPSGRAEQSIERCHLEGGQAAEQSPKVDGPKSDDSVNAEHPQRPGNACHSEDPEAKREGEEDGENGIRGALRKDGTEALVEKTRWDESQRSTPFLSRELFILLVRLYSYITPHWLQPQAASGEKE